MTDMDKIKQLFIGANVNGKIESIVKKEDFNKVYERYKTMKTFLDKKEVNQLEKDVMLTDDLELLSSMISKLIASHRLMEFEMNSDRAKIQVFKQKMQKIVEEI